MGSEASWLWRGNNERIPEVKMAKTGLVIADLTPKAQDIYRVCFINPFQVGRRDPQGLKPAFSLALNGTAEAVPYPKPIYEERSRKRRERRENPHARD
jgi:hypothetical protein